MFIIPSTNYIINLNAQLLVQIYNKFNLHLPFKIMMKSYAHSDKLMAFAIHGTYV